MFNNLGRQIVDSAITCMSRGVLKKKKKDLVRIMEKEGDNTPNYLMGVASRMHEMNSFEKNKSGFAVAFDYKSATHYYVSSLPDVIALKGISSGRILECLDTFDDIFTIETTVPGVDIFAQFNNLDKDKFSEGAVSINNVPIAWSCNVFLYYKEKPFGLVHYPLVYVYIGKDYKTLFFIANNHHPMTSVFSTSLATFKLDNTSYLVDVIDVHDRDSNLVTTAYNHLVKCLAYTYFEISRSRSNKDESEDVAEFLTDYLNKATNGKLDKPSNTKKAERAISTAHTGKVEVEVEDKLVPLHQYIKEYAPSIRRASKGGHHASPIPHDRRGYFRKSRGKGNYDLVNGEFVFVGDMQGTYSWVSATHVGCKNNTKPTYIYKV